MSLIKKLGYLTAFSFLALTSGIAGDRPNLHDNNRDNVQYNQNQGRSYDRQGRSTYFQQSGNYYYQKPSNVNRNVNGPSGMRFDQNGAVQYDYRQ